MLWNAGQFRRQFFDLNDLLKPMVKLDNLSRRQHHFQARAAALQGHPTASVAPRPTCGRPRCRPPVSTASEN
jgi:hypothetical protein